MRRPHLAILPTTFALLFDLFALPLAAQTGTGTATAISAPASGEKAPIERKVERIEHQDKSVTIDEVRVGGQTQSIEVKPSNDKLRPYQVQPENADAGISDKSSAKGLTNRSWKLFNF
jgi:hypothetical protein